jgi:hypothetical protein
VEGLPLLQHLFHNCFQEKNKNYCTKMLYTGQIENGQMHGKGVLVYPNGEKYDVITNIHNMTNILKGDWDHGKRHGKGKYFYSDGSIYDGEWVDDKVLYNGLIIYEFIDSRKRNMYIRKWKQICRRLV